MKLSSMYCPLRESTNKWMGTIENTLGNGKDWTINYGTGNPSMPNFLYISGPISLIKSAVRDAADNLVIWARPGSIKGKYLRIGQKSKEELASIRDSILASEPDAEIVFYPKVTHVGETHATVSMGPELLKAFDSEERILDALRSVVVRGRPLFDGRGNGQKSVVNIERSNPYLVMRAGFFRDDVDVSGPLVLAIAINCDLYYASRVALGLPGIFKFPNGEEWKQHLTVGYVPKKNMIHQSYVDRFGSSPREKRQRAPGSPVPAL